MTVDTTKTIDDIKAEIVQHRSQFPDEQWFRFEHFAMSLIDKQQSENTELIKWFGEGNECSPGKIEELISEYLERRREAAKRDIFIAICRNYDNDKDEVTVKIVGVYETSEDAIESLIDYEDYMFGGGLIRNDFVDHIDDDSAYMWQYQSPEYSAYRLIVVKQKLNPQSWLHRDTEI